MPTKRPSPPAHRSAAKAPRSHELRIIGGDWKRSKLKVLDKPGLRPTPDRVRETLFNWLGQDLTGWRCIDLFAGTGALGFEAASRGAVNVLVVEQDPALVEQLQRTQAHLKADMVRVQRGDGVAALRHSGAVGCIWKRPRPGRMRSCRVTACKCTATSRPGPCMRICCALSLGPSNRPLQQEPSDHVYRHHRRVSRHF